GLCLRQILNTARHRWMVNLAGSHEPEQRPGRLRSRAGGRLVAAIVELVARAVFTPAPVRILDGNEPVFGPADFSGAMLLAAGIERTKRGPGAIDIVQTPAPIPTSIPELRAKQITDAARQRFTVFRRFAELRQH